MVRSPCSDENGLKKGPWSPEEDQKLIQYIKNHGHGGWRALPKNAGLNRCGKSCRLRWTNYLRPDIKRGKFSSDEETTILNLHSTIGNKWSTIATHLPGRTDNEIKNFWNTHLKKKLIRMGFDPMTHRPRSELYTNLPPHLMALANLGEIIGYHHYQQQQQQQDLQQSKACQLASYNQYLECMLQAVEMTNSISNNANNPTVMEAMNMLPLPSLTGENGIVDDKMMIWDSHNFDNTTTSLTPSNTINSNQVSVSSALSNVQMSSNFEDVKDTPMNSERIQESSFMGLLHQEESLLKYHLMTPIVTAAAGSIINQEERYINNEGVGLISNSSCGGASSFLPELFYEEEPFIHGIS